MATDGMWDVVTNTEVSRELRAASGDSDIKENGAGGGDKKPEIVFTKMAKTLVELARGLKRDGFWEKTDGNLASGFKFKLMILDIYLFFR